MWCLSFGLFMAAAPVDRPGPIGESAFTGAFFTSGSVIDVVIDVAHAVTDRLFTGPLCAPEPPLCLACIGLMPLTLCSELRTLMSAIAEKAQASCF